MPSDTHTDEELICDCGDLLEVKLTERLKGMKPGQERRFAYQLAMLLRQRECAAKRELLEQVRFKSEMVECDCGLPEGLRRYVDAELDKLGGSDE